MSEHSWYPRSALLIGAVRRRIAGDVLRFVRSVCEDAGGVWTPDVAELARAKIESTLASPMLEHPIQYHAFDVARKWNSGGSRDADFPRMVRRVYNRLGPFIRDSATTGAVNLLIEVGGADKLGLTPAVAENLRERARRTRGDDTDPQSAEVG